MFGKLIGKSSSFPFLFTGRLFFPYRGRSNRRARKRGERLIRTAIIILESFPSPSCREMELLNCFDVFHSLLCRFAMAQFAFCHSRLLPDWFIVWLRPIIGLIPFPVYWRAAPSARRVISKLLENVICWMSDSWFSFNTDERAGGQFTCFGSVYSWKRNNFRKRRAFHNWNYFIANLLLLFQHCMIDQTHWYTKAPAWICRHLVFWNLTQLKFIMKKASPLHLLFRTRPFEIKFGMFLTYKSKILNVNQHLRILFAYLVQQRLATLTL